MYVCKKSWCHVPWSLMYVCVCTRAYIHIEICMYVCMYVRRVDVLYLISDVCVCVYMCIYTYVCMSWSLLFVWGEHKSQDASSAYTYPYTHAYIHTYCLAALFFAASLPALPNFMSIIFFLEAYIKAQDASSAYICPYAHTHTHTYTHTTFSPLFRGFLACAAEFHENNLLFAGLYKGSRRFLSIYISI